MCKRKCIYAGSQANCEKNNGCDCLYHLRAGRTRTGVLMSAYHLKPDSPELMRMLQGQNCPLFRPRGGKQPRQMEA